MLVLMTVASEAGTGLGSEATLEVIFVLFCFETVCNESTYLKQCLK